ncbi:hypothetical protein [Streptomyces sp. NPDC055886]
MTRQVGEQLALFAGPDSNARQEPAQRRRKELNEARQYGLRNRHAQKLPRYQKAA